MSFFRNIRSSISRGKSSSRDTTPVRVNTTTSSSITSSRPASIVSNAASSSTFYEGRRDSIDSRSDSILNRGETFILNSDQEIDQKNQNSNSNSSTLEKKSKKSKVLSKFSTFTKRKKQPQQSAATTSTTLENALTYEHHPSDNATNTYYKWNTDGGTNSNNDYDAQSDPFNFLYEQHSNLKMLKNGIDSTDNNRQNQQQQQQQQQHLLQNQIQNQNPGVFDSSTYRKGKATTQLKAQLEQLKTLHSTNNELNEEDQEPVSLEGDKYKTVTLNSFRKSFRDKYLQQQHEAPHNPSWFVEVDKSLKSDSDANYDAKENRPDYLVFQNENYRPGSRSPVRDRSAGGGGGDGGRKSRSNTRSPVKRNETFRVERSTTPQQHQKQRSAPNTTAIVNDNKNSSTSIRVEFKNSVMPHSITGRIVPVGVAKPMPSTKSTNHFTRPLIDNYATNSNSNNNITPYITTPHITTRNSTTTATTKSTSRTTSPQRSTYIKSTVNSTPSRTGKYQTLVQISNNNENNNVATKFGATPPFNRRNNRTASTRIQLNGGSGGVDSGVSALPITTKFNNNIGSRYSYAAPASAPPTTSRLNSYELLKQPKSQQHLKQTYFGDDITTKQSTTVHQPTRFMMSSITQSTLPVSFGATTTRTATLNNSSNFGNNNIQNTYINNNNNNNNNMNYINTVNANTNVKLRQHQSHSPKRSSSTVAVTGGGGIGLGTYLNRRDLRQSRFMPVTSQRRSRSPIKIPWR